MRRRPLRLELGEHQQTPPILDQGKEVPSCKLRGQTGKMIAPGPHPSLPVEDYGRERPSMASYFQLEDSALVHLHDDPGNYETGVDMDGSVTFCLKRSGDREKTQKYPVKPLKYGLYVEVARSSK
eukprot:gb/GECG01002289.1/.p1 GENE.gb/GECG01002289.1/~~gb/GECG01002289.1/.p1  ORF type:complete len:125 (+),score=13.66 gb/GECG01002289.1/:1-375(+)